MCGIVGYIGNKKGNEIVLEGLRRLEYRGYDSCGISYVTDHKLQVNKSIKRVADLIDNTKETADISIGHTRWATHGRVAIENAHPHLTSDLDMAIVHNGVVENYLELKEKFCSNNLFKSETDTEVLLYVLNNFYKETKDIHQAISKFKEVVEGSYAIIMYHEDFENQLFAIKHKSPMLIGKGNGFYTISSDPSAVIDQVQNFYQIDDYEHIHITEQGQEIKLYNQKGSEKEIKFTFIDMEYEEMTTLEYSTFLEKEIEEQPKALRNIVDNYQTLGFDENLMEKMKTSKKVYIIACGTSYHAGLISKRMIEDELSIPVEVKVASEYGYETKLIEDEAFFIFLSQSGETADSMLVFNQVLNKYPVLAVTNVRGSQMDRNADYSLQLFAGVEVSVASSKAYTSQIAVISLLVNMINKNDNIFQELLNVADFQEKIIADKEKFIGLAKKISQHREVFYLGRLRDYDLSQEAALKIKEITYINVNAFASGELKHGTISLIDPDKIIVGIITDPKIGGHTRSNIEEVKSRKGETYIISTKETAAKGDEYVIEYEGNNNLLPLVAIIPHQYIALHTAQSMKLDVDKPRNLAKSVTVE